MPSATSTPRSLLLWPQQKRRPCRRLTPTKSSIQKRACRTVSMTEPSPKRMAMSASGSTRLGQLLREPTPVLNGRCGTRCWSRAQMFPTRPELIFRTTTGTQGGSSSRRSRHTTKSSRTARCANRKGQPTPRLASFVLWDIVQYCSSLALKGPLWGENYFTMQR